MDLADSVFKRKTYNEVLLTAYGFKKENHRFTYSAPMLNGKFQLIIDVSNKGIKTDVIETAFNEPFNLYHIDDAGGAFIGQVRTAAEKILLDISEKCFYTEVFKTEQAKMCIEYVQAKYGDRLEFLWQKFPDNAIWRRNDNKKWYGALLTVSAKKLFIDSDETVEIIDLRMDPTEKENIIDGKSFFEGYHMNKNSWYTAILDGRVSDTKLQQLIDKSFQLAKKK